MLESANSFFSIPLSELSLFDITMVVLFVLALVLTIIFSLILISSKLRRIDSDIKDTSNTQISNNRAILNYLDLISEQLSTKPQTNPVNNSDVRNMEQNKSKATADLFEEEENLEGKIVVDQKEMPSINQEKAVAVINNRKNEDVQNFAEKELAEHQENISSISEEVLNSENAQQEHSLYNQQFDSSKLKQNLEEKRYSYNQNVSNNLDFQNNNIHENIKQNKVNVLTSEQLNNSKNANLQDNNEILHKQQLHNINPLISNNLENTNNLSKELERNNTRDINSDLQLPRLSLQVVEHRDVSPQKQANHPSLVNSYRNNLLSQNTNRFINQDTLNEKENFTIDQNLLDGKQLGKELSSTQASDFTHNDKINNAHLFRKYPNLSRQTLVSSQEENDNLLDQGRPSHNNFNSLLQNTKDNSNTIFHTPNMDKSEEFANRIRKSTLPKYSGNSEELDMQKPVLNQNLGNISRLRDIPAYKPSKNLSSGKEETNFSRFATQPNLLTNPNLSANRSIQMQKIKDFSNKSDQSNHFRSKENASPFAKPSLRAVNRPNKATNTQNEIRVNPSRLKTNSRSLYTNTTKDRPFISSFSRVKDTVTNQRPILGSRIQSSTRVPKPSAIGTRALGTNKNRAVGRIVEASRKNVSVSHNRDNSRMNSTNRTERSLERTRTSTNDSNKFSRRNEHRDRSLSSSRN